MTTFSRGWVRNVVQDGTGSAASITIPAVPGVVHILDSLSAALNNRTGGIVGFQVTTQTWYGIILTNQIYLAANGIDRFSFSELNIPSKPGGNIIVAFNGVAAANIGQELTLQGHDI